MGSAFDGSLETRTFVTSRDQDYSPRFPCFWASRLPGFLASAHPQAPRLAVPLRDGWQLYGSRSRPGPPVEAGRFPSFFSSACSSHHGRNHASKHLQGMTAQIPGSQQCISSASLLREVFLFYEIISLCLDAKSTGAPFAPHGGLVQKMSDTWRSL